MRRLASAACLLAVLATPVRAHQGHVLLRSERTIKLEIDGRQGLRVIVTVNYGEEEMLRLCRRADENGDGVLDDREASAHLEQWSEDLRRELPVRVDGGFRRIVWTDQFFEPTGPIVRRPGTLEMTGRVSVPTGRHELFFTDELPPDAFERTDVLYTSVNEGGLLSSGPSESPSELVPSFAYGPTTERRRVQAIGLVVTMPEPEGGVLPTRRPIGATGPLLFVLAQTLFAVWIGRMLRELRAKRSTKDA